MTPLAFLIIAAALKSMDPSLEESAKTLGSSELGVVSRITFPLMRPAILAAATLNFVRAVESFDTPAIIALPARIEVFTTKIWREALGSFPTNHNLAAAYGVGILMVALLFVYLYRRFTSQVESFSTVTGKGFRPHQIDLGNWKYLASAVAFLLLLLLVVLPILVLLLVAILPLLSRANLANLEQFDAGSLSLYLGHAKGSPSICKQSFFGTAGCNRLHAARFPGLLYYGPYKARR